MDDCWFNDDVPKLKQELEEIRAAYACCVDLIQAYQCVKDVDIDWDEFPKVTLAAAHAENVKLKARIKELEKLR